MTLPVYRTALDVLGIEGAARPLHLVPADSFAGWLQEMPAPARTWLEMTGFRAKPGRTSLFPNEAGELAGAVAILNDPAELWDVAAAVPHLPAGDWVPQDPKGLVGGSDVALAFALQSYRFTRYARNEQERPRLLVRDPAAHRRATALAEAIYLGRDLVNTPTNDLGPEHLHAVVEDLARAHGGTFRATVGEDLLTQNFPAIHAVGRASASAPRLLDLRWGDPGARKVTLVGKGVCFDTGGLDIKPSSAMLLMRKDMGGSALMIALAQAIMTLGLDVQLRLLVPAVENSISASAFRPGDILATRKGLTVEVGNTDAEGRLVLADALALADEDEPDLVIDAATLTGAARVALGPDVPALFTPDDALAADVLRHGQAVAEPLWRLPLHRPYARYLDSPVADINNAGAKPFAGATTAALFLQRFTATKAWMHLDIFAWNDEARPGRPRGGEATAFRPLLAMIEERFK